jgi:hypothetical protein
MIRLSTTHAGRKGRLAFVGEGRKRLVFCRIGRKQNKRRVYPRRCCRSQAQHRPRAPTARRRTRKAQTPTSSRSIREQRKEWGATSTVEKHTAAAKTCAGGRARESTERTTILNSMKAAPSFATGRCFFVLQLAIGARRPGGRVRRLRRSWVQVSLVGETASLNGACCSACWSQVRVMIKAEVSNCKCGGGRHRRSALLIWLAPKPLWVEWARRRAADTRRWVAARAAQRKCGRTVGIA